MSIPTSLDLPDGVTATRASLGHGTVAVLSATATAPRRGHVLLVPGWTGSKEDFTPVLPLLAAAGYDATTYDQPGQYESQPDEPYSLERFAAVALELGRRGGDGLHLLGHSFGGLVAQTAAVLDAGALASLSLLGTGPGALGESPQRPLRMLVDAIGTVPIEQIHRIRENGAVRPPQIAAFLQTRFLANDPASLRAMTQLLIDAPDIVEDVAATGLPVWVGRGADDDAWPHEVQAAMARRLGTEVQVIPGSAHSPAVENPDALVAAWLPFLQDHS